MNKLTRISVVGFTALSLLWLTILIMVGQAWARESQDVTVVKADKGTSTEFRQEAMSLNQPGIIQFLSGPNAGEPLDIALAFIQTNRTALGLSETDLADIVVTDLYQTKATGVTHIYLRQRYNGIEVANANININIAADGSVINLGSQFVSNLAESVREESPTLTAAAAVEAAAQSLKLNITRPLVVEKARGGADRAVVLSDGGISINPIPARLVYQPYRRSVRLAWNVTIYQLDSLHWWDMVIDAATGEVLAQADWVDSEYWGTPAASSLLTGTYRVYTYPAESPNHVFPLPPGDGRQLAIDPANSTASPFGWQDTDGANGPEFTTTQGNNVHAYTDTDDNNAPDPGSSPNGTTALDFDFPLDLTQPPGAYQPAAVTNLFYWNNLIHDVSYLHGFDEAAGNFQENNYGNGGAGSDYVFAEAQDGSGTDNANFATPPDGENPRMQMYIWTAPDPDKDGDLDNGIILHEYGHGISIRLTGGPANVNCLENDEQMGEGWSDWQSLIHTMEVGDAGTDVRGIGTYVLDQPVTGPGIRPQPYSTDFGVNNTTYGDLPAMAIPHGVGFVWATMLWEMNWELIGEHGFNPSIWDDWTTGGNNLAYRLIQDGMKLQPCSPGFVDGRDAILLADQVLTGGANECLIWKAFARRGLGFSASQESPGSASDGSEAFNLPPQCVFISKSASPDPAVPGGTLTYTLIVANNTITTLTNVVISDVVPLATTYVPGSASNGGSESGGVITWPAITMASGDSVTRTFQVTVASDVGTLQIFSDNFEGGAANWTMTGLWNEESQSDTCGTLIAPYPDPVNAVYYGQDGICDYDTSAPTVGELTVVNPIVLPSGSKATLSFQSYEETECGGGTCGFDNRNVQISSDGGSSWTTLSQGGLEAWHVSSFDLSPFAGEIILIRFQFDSGDDLFNNFFGWMVDDIRIAEHFFITNTACVTAAQGDNECHTIDTLVQGNVTTGTLAGTVTAAESGSAISGALVQADNGVQVFGALSNDSGNYTMTIPFDTYTVTASAANRLPVTVSGVDVVTGTTTIVDFVLEGGIFEYSPPAIEEFMEIGDAVTNTVTITNSGAYTVDWNVDIGNFGGPAFQVQPVAVTPLVNNGSTISQETVVYQVEGITAYGDIDIASATKDRFDIIREAPPITFNNGGLTIYTDRTVFDATYPGLPIENFENTLVPPNNVFVCDGPFDSMTNNACFSTGGILDGISLNTDTPGNQMVVLTAGFVGVPSAIVGPNSFTDELDIFFTEEVRAVGMDLFLPLVPGGNIDIGVYTTGDILIGTSTSSGDVNGVFWGAAADEPITRIHMAATGGEGELVDNIAFGNTISPWVTATPAGGSLPPLSVSTFDVVFDARSLHQVGDYTADLAFSGTFINDVPVMPLTMHLSCPTCGFLNGSITDAWTGDPLAADINITDAGGFDITVNGATSYSVALPAGDYDVFASASGYITETASVTLVAGMTVTQDFALEPIIALLEYSPDVYEATVALGSIFTGTMTVTNSGTVPFDYTLTDSEVGISALNCSSPNLPISDGPHIDDLVIADGGSLNDVNISLDITHSWVGDLIVELEHADSGTTLTLVDQPGLPNIQPFDGCNDNDLVDFILDDESANGPHDDACPNTNATPAYPASSDWDPIETSLSVFDGENVNGTWSLSVTDAFPTADNGTLNQWCLITKVDVPWLSEDPDSGTIDAGSAADVNVIFDASIVAVGTYTANINFAGTYDNDVAPALAIMHVITPVYALDISPDAALSGDPGTTVTYTVTVSNNSNVADVINLAVSGQSWVTTLSDSSLSLSAGESGEVQVTVAIPAGAAGGAMDMATITATSQGSGGSTTAATNLITTANAVYSGLFYLPVIVKP